MATVKDLNNKVDLSKYNEKMATIEKALVPSGGLDGQVLVCDENEYVWKNQMSCEDYLPSETVELPDGDLLSNMVLSESYEKLLAVKDFNTDEKDDIIEQLLLRVSELESIIKDNNLVRKN